jgi:hypothetical protein
MHIQVAEELLEDRTNAAFQFPLSRQEDWTDGLRLDGQADPDCDRICFLLTN